MSARPPDPQLNRSPDRTALRDLLRPARLGIDGRERLRVLLGALLVIAVVAGLSRLMPQRPGLPWLLAPLGASAVLVFALPASPLAQPWAVVGGNAVSALAGLVCVHLLPWPVLAAPAAVACAIGAMLALRCLHPPGGAVALLAVVAGVDDWHYLLTPTLLDSVLLVAGGWVYNASTGKRYPHPQVLPAAPSPRAAARAWDFSDEDLSAVMARYNQVLDMPRDDLRDLLVDAEQQALGRRLRALRCRDIMTPNPVRVSFGTPLPQAWRRLHEAGVKALPVVDRSDHVVGIVTRADFLRGAGLAQAADPASLVPRLRQWLQPAPGVHSDKPEVVGQIMTRQVRVASADRPVADLLGLFSHEGHHHLPVIDAEHRLLGILTQTDVVAALADRQGA